MKMRWLAAIGVVLFASGSWAVPSAQSSQEGGRAVSPPAGGATSGGQNQEGPNGEGDGGANTSGANDSVTHTIPPTTARPADTDPRYRRPGHGPRSLPSDRGQQ